VMDEDLGPNDGLSPRLGRADTVVMLDLQAGWPTARKHS